MDELFSIPEQLSPRLRWMKEHDIGTHRYSHCGYEDAQPWGAWQGDLQKAIDSGYLFSGDTEDEAIIALAKRRGLKLWNE